MNGEHLIGNVVNERYELLEIIGNGGMAIVYKANDRLLNRNVAVKILKDSLKDDHDIVDKFDAESKAAAALSHNNIVSVYDVGQIDGLNFIVMEYVEGCTLKEYINNNKPIKWQTACDIGIQIAEALNAAHEHGIIHRDIKPHNILITKESIVKVTDFGIASAVSSDTTVAGGSALGSVNYISPEQARGGFVDKTSDIYSLGVVMYAMLTGSLPFEGDNAVSIALKKLSEEPISPKVINLDIPQSLDAIIMKAISKEQHIRYKDANELISDLKALLNEDSMHIVAAQKKNDEEVSKPERRKFNPIIASVVLLVLIAVSVFAVMRGGSKEYIVPDLLGKTLEEALLIVEDSDFTIDEDGILYEVSEEFPEGQIIKQNPGANQSVKKNKKIQLTISSGEVEGDISVPAVVDMLFEDAKALLESKGLKYQVIDEEGVQENLNYVLKQSPKSETKVTQGYVVILHVCTKISESEIVEVPDLTGLTRSQAEKLLNAEGLVLGNTSKEKSDKEVDLIISQNPKAEEKVQRNTTVDIVISEGNQQEPSQDNPSTNNPQQSGNTGEMKRKTLTIKFPETAGDSVHVKVLANGKEIHNQSHPKEEGKVDIVVQSNKDAEVEVYMDNELVVRKIVEFE